MLKVFRDNLKYLSWVLWVVIAVFVLFVFVDFGSGVPSSMRTDRAAATVGDAQVSYEEFQREYRQIDDQMRTSLGDQYTPELAEQLKIPLQALDRVVNRKILLESARELGLTVTDEDLKSYIVSLPVFRQDGRFVGEQAYQRGVRQLGYSPASFEAAIREQLLVERLVGALESSVVVPESRVEERYREQVERASIRYVALPFSEVAGEVTVSDEEVAEYFATHRTDYEIPEERVAQYLLVDQNRVRETLELAGAEIDAYYREHEDEYRQEEQVRARHVLVSAEDRSPEEARERIEEARERLAAGEDFAAVAAAYSDDPGSGSRGGDLGFFGRGRMVPAFEEAAFGAPPGELIGPVETQFGFHLIEVVEHREARQRPLEEVRELIANRLRATTAQERAEALAGRLREELADDPSAERMEALAAENPAVESGTTGPFRQLGGAVEPLGTAPGVASAAFLLDQGVLSAPVRAPRGWVVLQVTEIHPPREPELSEVRGAVETDARDAKASEVAVARLAEAAAGPEGAARLERAAATLGLQLQEAGPFGRGATVQGLGSAPQLVERALTLDEGSVGGPLATENRAVLFEVTSRERFTPEGFEESRRQLAEQLRQQELNQLLGALVAQKRRELGVTYDRQLLESFDLMELAEETS
jgi:peptidyl-prolyl cis-trans isomerase D